MDFGEEETRYIASGPTMQRSNELDTTKSCIKTKSDKAPLVMAHIKSKLVQTPNLHSLVKTSGIGTWSMKQERNPGAEADRWDARDRPGTELARSRRSI